MEIPTDVADLLRRLAVRGWKSENFEYVTQAAVGLCSAYGIEYGTTPELSKSDPALTRNTAALIEWFELCSSLSLKSFKDSKVLHALLGYLSEEQAQKHYARLCKAKERELTWNIMINRVKPISHRTAETEEPRVQALLWLEEQLRNAKDDTYEIARQAIADNLQALSF